MKPACLQMYMKLTSNINKNQKPCLTDLFNSFIACLSWRILKHRPNRIFDCHLTRISEPFQNANTNIYIIN